MRILILSQFWEPEPILKGLSFAKALAEPGHEVRAITGFPNYPGGHIYKGYRLRPYQHEVMDGIQITRVALYPSHSRSRIGRILNYGSFAASALFAGLLTRFKPDVIYVYHPPITVGVAAAIIGFLRRIPFTLDIQDLWPDALRATGMVGNESILKLIGTLTRWVYRQAGTVITESPGFVERLVQCGVPPEKIHLVYNWCNEDDLSARAQDVHGARDILAGKFNVIFAGNMGVGQGLGAVLDTASLLATRPDIQFVFVGSGTEVESLKEEARQRQLGNTVFLPRMPMAEVGHVLDAADVLLVHLKRDPLFAMTIPSKTQAYLFAGKPILMGVEGDAAALVLEAGAGITAVPEDPSSLAEGVLALAALSPMERKAMGDRGRRYYDEHLSLKAGAGKILEALAAAASSTPKSTATTAVAQ